MVNRFETIEELNNYYAGLFLNLTDIADRLGLSAEESMRKALLDAYKNDLEIVVFNDKYEKDTYKKRIELDRKKSKQDDFFNKKRLKFFLKKCKRRNKKLFKKYKKSFFEIEKNGLNTSVFNDVCLATNQDKMRLNNLHNADSSAQNSNDISQG